MAAPWDEKAFNWFIKSRVKVLQQNVFFNFPLSGRFTNYNKQHDKYNLFLQSSAFTKLILCFSQNIWVKLSSQSEVITYNIQYLVGS